MMAEKKSRRQILNGQQARKQSDQALKRVRARQRREWLQKNKPTIKAYIWGALAVAAACATTYVLTTTMVTS